MLMMLLMIMSSFMRFSLSKASFILFTSFFGSWFFSRWLGISWLWA